MTEVLARMIDATEAFLHGLADSPDEAPEVVLGRHIAKAALESRIRVVLVGRRVDTDRMMCAILDSTPTMMRGSEISADRRRLKLNNGTIVQSYGLEPERLLGLQAHITWVAGKVPLQVYDYARYMTQLGKAEMYVL